MTHSPGTRLGPYEISAAIGAGGMGEVYRARDTKLGRDVAIKVLPAEVAKDAERLARFKREAQLLAALNHPNIAAIHGLDEALGQMFLVLELVEGEDLSQRLKRDAIPVDEAIAIARQIAEALEEAHEKGIVHRDLKPANIKLTPDGKVKVLDFGLAKAYASDSASSGSVELSHSPTMTRQGTEAGMILGTAAYMSPEQARGKTVDKRADIWAFGVVLFEMLTGKRLFAGETVSDTLAAVLRQDVDWNLLPKDLSPADRRLIERCLERDPKKRLRDIGEARLALDDTGARIPTPVVPAVLSPADRQGRFWWMTVAATVAFAAGVGVGARFNRPAVDRTDSATLRITPITGSGNVIQAAISPDGRYLAYVESDQGRQSLWLKQLAGGQTLRLIPDQNVSYWGHTFTPDGNSIVFGLKTPTDPRGGLFSISTLGGNPRRLLSDLDSQVSFSPDGQRFAYTRLRHPTPEETSLMVASADGGNPAVLASFKLPDSVAAIFFGAPAWSPDGSTIVTAVFRQGSQGSESRAKLVRVAVEGGAVSTFADPGWATAAQASWLPDGRSLLVIARSGDQSNTQIWSVSYPGGEARPVTADLNDHRIISLTRDGRSLVSIAGVVSASVWTLPLRGAGRPTRVSRSTTDGLGGVAFAPDGSVVYTSYVGGVWSLWTADPDGVDRSPLLTAGAGETLGFPSVSDNGVIYYALRTGSGSEIRAAPKDGSSSRVVTGDARFDTAAITRDGRSLVYGSAVGGIPHLFRISPEGGERTQISGEVAFTPALHASGKRVAFYFIGSEGRFRLGVSSIDGGPLLANLTAEPPTNNSRLVLMDGGIYLNTMPGDRANVWLMPIDGRPARKVTSFDDQQLFDFAISRDGGTLAVVRGPRIRDAQLITGFDQATRP